MNISTKALNSGNSGQHRHAIDDPVCQVCKDRKYIFAATRKIGKASTIYERQPCQACSGEEKVIPVESDIRQAKVGKKPQNGTGYLRNKKRRRKEGV